MKKYISSIFTLMLMCIVLFTGCSKTDSEIIMEIPENNLYDNAETNTVNPTDDVVYEEKENEKIDYDKEPASIKDVDDKFDNSVSNDIINSYFNQSDVSIYSSEPSIIVNNNVPFFTLENEGMQPIDSSWEYYNQLDNLGRTQIARANLSQETMPAENEERGEIGHIRPAGWHTSNYRETDVDIDGNYLYNRCHLIGWQLSGENDNPLNLITGTRYLNVNGMLPYENMIAEYIRTTGNNVLYRVTPCYNGNNLICDGILLEVMSVQEPENFAFCVYCYNVQPGVYIDYATGENCPESELTDTHNENLSSYLYAVCPKDGTIHIVGNCPLTDENSKSYMVDPTYYTDFYVAEDYAISLVPDQDDRICDNCFN